jgi:predicted transcriptional regulator
MMLIPYRVFMYYEYNGNCPTTAAEFADKKIIEINEQIVNWPDCRHHFCTRRKKEKQGFEVDNVLLVPVVLII